MITGPNMGVNHLAGPYRCICPGRAGADRTHRSYIHTHRRLRRSRQRSFNLYG
jgi:hypothetical protein